MADTPADVLGTSDAIPPNLAAPAPTGAVTGIPAAVAAPAAGTDMPTPMGSMPGSEVPASTDPEIAAGTVHQNWLARILDSVGTILGGDKTIVATKHPDGSVSVEHNPSTTGEKWGRIAQAALGGAARGMAAGQGPGGAGKAFAAGGLAGLQMPAQQLAAANEEAKNMNAEQLAAANIALTHQGYLANAEQMRERQIKFTQDQADRYNAILKSTRDAPGSEDLGDFVGVTDLPSLQAKYPQAYAAHLSQNDKVLQFDPKIDPKTGQQTGSHITLLSKPLSERVMPPGTPPLTQSYYDPATHSIQSRDIDPTAMTRVEYSTAHQNLTKQNSDLALNVDKDLHKAPTTQEELQTALQLEPNPIKRQALQTAYDNREHDILREKAAGRAPQPGGLMAGAGGAASAGTTGDAYLQAAVDPSMWNQVRSIANGDVRMPTAGMRGANQALRNAVMNYDPTFTDARYQTKMDFKTKGDANSITQLATVLAHAERAKTNSAALGLSPSLATGKNLSGDASAYNTDVNFFTGEAGKLALGGVVGLAEADKISSQLTSPVQSIRDSALNEVLDLTSGKVGAIVQKYRNGAGQELPAHEFFDQPTQNLLKRFNIINPAAEPTAPTAAPAAAAPASAATNTTSTPPATGYTRGVNSAQFPITQNADGTVKKQWNGQTWATLP